MLHGAVGLGSCFLLHCCCCCWTVGWPAVQQVVTWDVSALHCCCRPLVSCSAEPEPVSGYTPADYISFSTDENKQCHHNAEVWVEAPLETCYSLWSSWTKLLDFLDLVGQVRTQLGAAQLLLCATVCVPSQLWLMYGCERKCRGTHCCAAGCGGFISSWLVQCLCLQQTNCGSCLMLSTS